MTSSWLALLWIVVKILAIALPLMGAVAYLTLAERKVIGYIQSRIGPNRVGILGLGQPLADGLKLLTKEMVCPTPSSRYLFKVAPVLSLVPALLAWAVVPFAKGMVLADINAGVLFILAISSLGVYGLLVAGWASNTKYAFLGAMRACAQTVSYEIAMGFSLVCVLLAAGSMNLQSIILHQQGGLWHWYAFPLLPVFVVYWIAGVAETNRAPFDMAEGESEIVAGFHVEYSGMRFAVFFLAEYMSMILISAVAAIAFLGGWLSPFEGLPYLSAATAWVPGLIWFVLKTSLFLFLYLWMRATFPRYRYDQVMRLGWKVLIPVTLVWVLCVALAVQCGLPPWFSRVGG